MKDSASMYMWLPKSEVSFIEYILKDIGFHVRSTLVWCKTNPTPNILNIGYMHSTEFCTYATKLPGSKHYWNTKNRNVQSYWVKPICQGNERTAHPTQKRLDIAEEMIIQSCEKGGTLLDPFCGSGTFPVAARLCGLNYIAFEQDKNFYEIAKKRIDQEVNQMNIFDFL